MILKSMDHIVKVFGNVSTAPKLNFKLQFIGFKCVSTPSVDEICDQYCSVLNLVSNYVVLYYRIIFILNVNSVVITFFDNKNALQFPYNYLPFYCLHCNLDQIY